MIRRPPRSTLFPTRRSSDLNVADPLTKPLPRAKHDQHQDFRSEEHTSELQSRVELVCRLLLEKKKKAEEHLPRQHAQEVAREERSDDQQQQHVIALPHAKRHFFFFNDTATTEIYTLSLHDALPI